MILGIPSKRQLRKNAIAWEAALGREETFQAIPSPALYVEEKTDSQGCIHIRFSPPPRPGLAHWLARRFNWRSRARFAFDADGTRFWQLIDGKTDLATIAQRLEEPLEMGPTQARRAVALFTYDLMCRNLILLRRPDSPGSSE